jgi:hypothetical protein
MIMTSKFEKLEVTQQLLLKADTRSDFFPSLMFSDTAWKVILHLYIALCEGLTMTESIVIKLINESGSDGHLALYRLGKDGYVEPRTSGDDVSLTKDAVQSLQDYLDFIHVLTDKNLS